MSWASAVRLYGYPLNGLVPDRPHSNHLRVVGGVFSMPHEHRLVTNTPEELRLRAQLGVAGRRGLPSREVRLLQIRYNLAVARRKATEYAAEAERLEAELERVQ